LASRPTPCDGAAELAKARHLLKPQLLPAHTRRRAGSGTKGHLHCAPVGPAAHLRRRAEDVAPYLLSHIGPSYSQTTPARARVQRLPSNSSYGGCTAENTEDAEGTAPRRFLAGVAAFCDRRCLPLEWFRRSDQLASLHFSPSRFARLTAATSSLEIVGAFGAPVTPKPHPPRAGSGTMGHLRLLCRGYIERL
jgi:hypothetical protein